ncbi:MAG: diguanylate cyclase [Lachnospiraceae bacterium]|nr:diguanylate cyclase [Lachnospiraceae bacterium]
MVQMSQVITANVAALVLLIIVKLHMWNQYKAGRLLDIKLLSGMMNLTMLECIFDTLVFWIDGQNFFGAHVINYTGNIIYYILKVAIAYFWPLFIEYKITSSFEKVKKLAAILAIPLIACSLMVLTAPFNGIIFSINEDNIYTRTGFYFIIPNLLIFVYVILGTINVYINREKKDKYLLIPAIFFIVPVSLAIIAQVFNYGISLTFIGIAIGLTGVYLSTQNESAYIDQLCGVYNRRYYNDYVRSFCNSRKKDEFLVGILIDMDNFKYINDKYGHYAGDKALQLFGSILRKQIEDIGFAVRYGGDEFILITKQSEEAVYAVVSNIVKEIDEINATGKNEFQLSFSYGMANLNSDSNMNEFLRTMDARMYEMKRNKNIQNEETQQ